MAEGSRPEGGRDSEPPGVCEYGSPYGAGISRTMIRFVAPGVPGRGRR